MKTDHRTSRTKVFRCPVHWTVAQRLAHYTKADLVSGCLVWQGAVEANGYGRIGYRGRNHLAHRLSWTSKHGPIPNGMEICHRCDERRCVNVDHLFLGSHSVNMADLRQKRQNWYGAAEPRADTTRRSQVEPSLAPIRVLYRGIEFVGRAIARPIDPKMLLPMLAPPTRAAKPSPARDRRSKRRGSRDGRSARRSGARS